MTTLFRCPIIEGSLCQEHSGCFRQESQQSCGLRQGAVIPISIFVFLINAA